MSESNVNWAKWTGVVLLAALTLLAIAFVHSERRATTAIAIGIFASAVAVCLVMIASQDRPFAGPFAVKPDPLVQVMPKHVKQGRFVGGRRRERVVVDPSRSAPPRTGVANATAIWTEGHRTEGRRVQFPRDRSGPRELSGAFFNCEAPSATKPSPAHPLTGRASSTSHDPHDEYSPGVKMPSG